MTARKIKPGSYDDFIEAFLADRDNWPDGLVRVYALRSIEDEDQVVNFGFFDGTVDELRAAQSSPGGYEAQQERIAPYVESVSLSGVFEVVREEAGPG